MSKTCKINFMWDNEVFVWIATSEDVPGLALEDGSLDRLIFRAKLATQELLELNCGYIGNIDFEFEMSRAERLIAIG